MNMFNTSITAATAGAAAIEKLDFTQLQDLTNRWTNELEHEEKRFVEILVRINSWHRTQAYNRSKVDKLYEAVEKIKADNKKYDETIEKVKKDQREMERMIEILEANTPEPRPMLPERAKLYSTAKKIDTEIKNLHENMVEVTRYFNDVNKISDRSDHLTQIFKILNEHTEALNWINANVKSAKLTYDDVKYAQEFYRKCYELHVTSLKPNKH